MIELKEKYKSSLSEYKFIDLFSGIGGFHYALKSFGAECAFASEWDRHAAKIYFKNIGLLPEGDITEINEKDIPHHDILCAGFPCQAFSVSGKQKGFEDTRGTLFFDIARIVQYHRPKILILENVKNLVKHDGGNTLEIILTVLKDLDYNVSFKVLNASHFGLPQNRERVYFVAFHNSFFEENFKFPERTNQLVSLNDVLESNSEDAKIIERDDINIYKKIDGSSSLFEETEIPNKPIQIGKVNKGGQGERIYHPNGHSITLSAHGGGVGAKTGLYLIDGSIRKLTRRECARLQGFPESFQFDESKSQAYKQFGNSIAIDVLQHIIKNIIDTWRRNEQSTEFRFADSQEWV
jgi:DNA (cytosine-5)-methyltransferase 1